MKTNSLPPALVSFLTLAFVLAPAVTPPFMGYLPGQLPVDVGRPLIQPAGYAFSIWGVIYLWLIAHALFGLIWRRDDPAWMAPRPPLIFALALGTLWLAIAAHWPLAASATIALMALGALAAFLRADPKADRWIAIAPLAVFAGWLTAATLVSFGIILAGYGVLSNEGAAYTMLALALGLGLALQARQPSMPLFGAALVWALAAVAAVNRTGPESVAIAAALAAAITAAGTGALWWRARG